MKSLTFFENLKSQKISYLIFGLGNPEIQYKKTRHNIGKVFINEFARELKVNFIENKLCQYFVYECVNPNRNRKIAPTKIVLIKPNGYMNDQGVIIKAIRDGIDDTIPIQRIKVICDDLETDLGKVKFSLTGGDRGHNGLKSVHKCFGSNEFEKIKIGIGRPSSKDPDVVANYVLQNFPEEHLKVIRENVYPKIIKAFNIL